jgi:hypothetical protein
MKYIKLDFFCLPCYELYFTLHQLLYDRKLKLHMRITGIKP